MLIDGEEVIYSMEDDTVVYPEIPTEGLVCYLDTRGKYNTDVYRNTLLDLSGNGNHGTLQDFNFTEESGYVKDLSGGSDGLKFDGVDDKLTTNVYMSQDFTIFTELNIPATMKGDMRFTIDYQEGSFYSAAGIQIIENYILYRIAVRKDGDTITMFANETKGELTDIKVYNRALTDEEIAQLMEVE